MCFTEAQAAQIEAFLTICGVSAQAAQIVRAYLKQQVRSKLARYLTFVGIVGSSLDSLRSKSLRAPRLLLAALPRFRGYFLNFPEPPRGMFGGVLDDAGWPKDVPKSLGMPLGGSLGGFMGALVATSPNIGPKKGFPPPPKTAHIVCKPPVQKSGFLTCGPKTVKNDFSNLFFFFRGPQGTPKSPKSCFGASPKLSRRKYSKASPKIGVAVPADGPTTFQIMVGFEIFLAHEENTNMVQN